MKVKEAMHRGASWIDPEDAVKAVFAVLSRHLSDGLLENVRHALPKSIAGLWPEMAG